ncbi:MAG: hypothetical protein ACQXXL_07080 [Candidatus Methanosuratincola sp.]|jgi:hypothetical protein|nr:hypothetical protein [Candidatus Methanosuratincola sp.]
MEMDVGNKLSREIRSFSSLLVINIAFSGIAMALGVALAVTNIQALLSGWAAINFAASAVGVTAFVLAMRWLVSTAELFDGVDEIKEERSRIKGSRDLQALAGLIARLAAHYRSNRQLISRLILLTKAAGLCFIVNGALVLLQVVLSSPADWASAMGMVAAAAVNLGVGAAGLAIPHFFSKYSLCWEARLRGIAEAEGRLSGLVGGE